MKVTKPATYRPGPVLGEAVQVAVIPGIVEGEENRIEILFQLDDSPQRLFIELTDRELDNIIRVRKEARELREDAGRQMFKQLDSDGKPKPLARWFE